MGRSADEIVAPDNVLPTLVRVYGAVRRRVAHLPAVSASPIGINLHGHPQQPFDLAADQVVLEELRASFSDGIVLSEESGLQRFGDSAPRWRFVVDPVDGSDNHSRRLPLSAVSIAVLEPEGPLALHQVRWAVVGGFDEDHPLVAGKDLGCHRGEAAASVSQVRVLRDAFVSCELNHFAPTRPLATVLSRARGVRSYGCASRALALVACGSLDAHLDMRGRLTAESFLAAAFMVEQAGGCVLDLDGSGFQHLTDLTATARIVAAATAELAHEIANELKEL
jgi:myo-inositol-1(or 4)-monophosphatase